jgi:hypothetical protein
MMSAPSLELPPGFAEEFQEQLDSLPDLGTRSRGKFATLEKWVERKIQRSARATYVSSLRKQFTARVGQALAGLPQVMVLLCPESWAKPQASGHAYVERLEALVRYATGLEAVVACVGEERRWTVEFVVGLASSELRADLARVLGPGVDRAVDT